MFVVLNNMNEFCANLTFKSMMPNLITKDEQELAHLSSGRVTLTTHRIILFRKNRSIQRSISLKEVDRISLSHQRSSIALASAVLGMLLILIGLALGNLMLIIAFFWFGVSMVTYLSSRKSTLRISVNRENINISLQQYAGSMKKLLADAQQAHFNFMHKYAREEKKDTKTVTLNSKVS